MPFADRSEAGRKLGAKLAAYKDQRPVVLALPRGGVPVAAEVAKVLDAPLDLILVRKIGVPFQPELAMGAIVDGKSPVIVRNEDVIGAVGVDDKQFKAICDQQLAEIERRRMRYLGDRTRAEVSGRTVIVVDDGVATGATMRAALRATRQRGPRQLILAVPVAPPDAIEGLREEADEVVCLETHAFFGAIGAYYLDFRQVEDEDVTGLLALFPVRKAELPQATAASPVAKP